MLKKTLFVICDGLGDRPIEELGNLTPLEAANTPNLDYFAKNAECGVMTAVARGVRPGSDTSHLEIFGYPVEKYYTGRGPIECVGVGIKLQQGDVAFRGNMGTVDEEWNIIDRRAGRIKNTEPFAKALDGMKIDGVTFIVKKATGYRVGVTMRGKGLSSAITEADPHEEGKPLNEVKPTDNSKEALFTATVLNKFLKKSYEILKNMDENIERRKNGELEANFVLLRGAGEYITVPTFEETYNLKACCIAGAGCYKGIGLFLGMDLIDVEGATGLVDTNIENKIKVAIEKLNEYDFVFVHIKAADSLAEDGNYIGKKEFIERIDQAIGLAKDVSEETIVVVTADHTTPTVLKAHSADPVPIMYSAKGIRIDDVESFGERSCAKGILGQMEGKHVMKHVLNLMGKLHLLGA